MNGNGNDSVNTRSKSQETDAISELITELGKDGLSDITINKLVLGLRREYPQNDMILRISEAIGTEQNEDRDESEFPWILFSIDETAYAMNSKYVLSIEILGDITPIVDAPHFSPGITRSRGEMIDLLDMRALFGMGDYKAAKEDVADAVYMMVVTEIDGQKRGLIVDEIISVEYITRFDDGISSDDIAAKDRKITSQYVGKVARREKSDQPVLILIPESLSTQ